LCTSDGWRLSDRTLRESVVAVGTEAGIGPDSDGEPFGTTS